MTQNKPDLGSMYRIKLIGFLSSSTTDWFGDITIIPQENGETILVGRFADQPALRGFLDQLWNLNFTLLSVERIVSENNSIELKL